MITDDKSPLRLFGKAGQLGFFESKPITLRVRENISIFFHDLRRFLDCLLRFVVSRTFFLIKSFYKILTNLVKTKNNLRAYTLRKLLWKRGTLFRPTSHAFVLALSFVVVIVGGGFSTSSIILGQGAAYDPDVSENGKDVIAADVNPETEVPEDRPREETIEYVVKEGDTLSSIGERFRVSIEYIKYANNLTNIHALSIDQKLLITPSGLLHETKEGDTVEGLAKKYSVSPQAIVDFNYLEEPFELHVGQELTIPEAQIPEPPRPAVPTPYYAAAPDVSLDGAPAGTGQFVWPTNTRYVSQYFRAYHPAIDIAKESPIYAADGGRVVEAVYDGWNYGYGKYVRIDHGNGYTTMYAHLGEVYISPGEDVSRGQTIAQMGCTGRCWGTHVHFIVQYNGQYIDPLSVF